MLDRGNLLEIVDAFIDETVAVPSDRLIRALAEASGQSAEAVRALFEARHRQRGHESALFDTLPFSGSG